MIRKILLSVLTFLFFGTSFGQKIIDLKNHLQFFDFSDSLNKGKNICVQNISVKFSYYINDTIILKQIFVKVPEQSKKEIQQKIKKDKKIYFEKNMRVTLFSEIEVDSMHQGLNYPIIEGANREQSQAAYRNAINARKNTLPINLQEIYRFSNLYYNKNKTYALLLIVTSTVGDSKEQIMLFKKQKKEWSILESLRMN
jgi:hypothetical protein